MNGNSTVGASLSALGGFTQNVNITKIDNGYVISWYNREQHSYHCANLDEVKDKLQEVFNPNDPK